MPPLAPLSWDLGDPIPDQARLVMGLAPGDPPLVVQLGWQVEAIGAMETGIGAIPQALSADLNPAELARLDSFRHPWDRWRHGLARAGLRRLLGQLLDTAPAALLFQVGRDGKPELAPSPRLPSPPQFNLSHAGELVLLALHPSQAVGVDGERLDRRCNLERLSPRLLTEQQLSDQASLPADQRHAFLLRQWCRLEAQLKCSGRGLAGLEALRQAQATRAPSTHLVDLALPAGYCGALAWAQAPLQPLMASNSASTEA